MADERALGDRKRLRRVLKANRVTVPRSSSRAVAVDDFVAALVKLTGLLERICRDRVEYPDDTERIDDLRCALLEGHRILAALNDAYGNDRDYE